MTKSARSKPQNEYVIESIDPAHICFEKKDGSCLLLPYHQFLSGIFEPGDKIKLTFVTKSVSISGRGLVPVFESIHLQKLFKLKEAQSEFESESQKLSIVTSIILI